MGLELLLLQQRKNKMFLPRNSAKQLWSTLESQPVNSIATPANNRETRKVSAVPHREGQENKTYVLPVCVILCGEHTAVGTKAVSDVTIGAKILW